MRAKMDVGMGSNRWKESKWGEKWVWEPGLGPEIKKRKEREGHREWMEPMEWISC